MPFASRRVALSDVSTGPGISRYCLLEEHSQMVLQYSTRLQFRGTNSNSIILRGTLASYYALRNHAATYLYSVHRISRGLTSDVLIMKSR
jgi:hypothetical protein